jgi:hypothetical protein
MLPVAFTLITSEGWSQPLWVGGLILALELISNNVLEPWLYGSQLGLSEVGLIMAAVAWTFLWGPVGLILATPLTVCLVVLGQYIPAFSVFARLLGDMPVLEPHYRFYQRLLADDPVEAMDLVKKEVAENGLQSAMDTILAPALSLAERDEAAGLLEVEDEDRMAAALERIFKETLEFTANEAAEKEGEAAPAEGKTDSGVCVIVWPVIDLASHAGPWLKWLLRDLDCEVILLSSNTLSAEAANLANEKQPAAFVMLSLAESPIRRERQLGKRIGTVAASVPIIAARLGYVAPALGGDGENSAPASSADLTITHTLSETCAAVRPLVTHAQVAS